jgi:aminoglycoside phosphotransferase family enzyme/predicted kinase
VVRNVKPQPVSHEQIVRSLLRPDAYPHPVDAIALKETHGAWVLLAGGYAYKLKKPVDFGFFDYSTFEKRAADAEAEVRLNRRLAPSTYLGLVDIVERDGEVFVGGEGRVLERAVRMRRLPEAGMLAELLSRDAASPQLMRRIARLIARFHQSAPTGPGIDESGKRPNLLANWRENFDQIAPFIGVVMPADRVESIRRYVGRFLAENGELLDRRVSQGRIRDGHGDLHAASICLDRRELVVFDCIQFAARYRCADVAADVAFLAMDLDHAGHADLGWAFVDEYLKRSADSELADVIAFYKCYLAFVRGKVLALRLEQGHLSDSERRDLAEESSSYFDLAAAQVASGGRSKVIVMSGLPASGKTTLARQLARHLGLVYLSTDVTRKRRAGMNPTERAPAVFGAGLYEPDVTRATYGQMRRDAAKWLRRGLSVVLDGTFGSSRERDLVGGLARRTNAEFSLIVTQCDDEIARHRLDARRRDADNVSDATWETHTEMRQTYIDPDEVPDAEKIIDRSGGRDVDGVVARLLKASGPP